MRAEAAKVSNSILEEIGYIPITSFGRFEVIQALRFEAWLHNKDRSKGTPTALIDVALNLFLAQLGSNIKILSAEWSVVFAEAERLTQGTIENGWRSLDLIHVASASCLGAERFYSFDRQQNLLATKAGLDAPFLRGK
jgi:hypothetical protein